MLPGQAGIAVFSPPLDAKGNSLRGIEVFEELSTRFSLHFMEVLFHNNTFGHALEPPPADGDRPMTYCLAIRLDAGFVVGSDSRTNAGVDYVTSYSKMHSFQPAPDRVFTILSAGNLATTQQVLFHVQRDLDDPGSTRNLRTVSYLFEAAEYLGEVSARVQELHRTTMAASGVNVETTLILAGQVGTEVPEIFLIYPQGNFITASDATPYLQIGETKYGKPVLDRLVHAEQSLTLAARVALLSLDGTARSNLSVAAAVRDRHLRPRLARAARALRARRRLGRGAPRPVGHEPGHRHRPRAARVLPPRLTAAVP